MRQATGVTNHHPLLACDGVLLNEFELVDPFRPSLRADDRAL